MVSVVVLLMIAKDPSIDQVLEMENLRLRIHFQRLSVGLYFAYT